MSRLCEGTGRPPAGWDADQAAERIRAGARRLADVLAGLRSERPSWTKAESHSEADRVLAAEALA